MDFEKIQSVLDWILDVLKNLLSTVFSIKNRTEEEIDAYKDAPKDE